jgi:CheY-like chemotaxis protein
MKAHLHILSAEDQRLYAEMVSTLFEGAGHTVVTAEDGQEALDLAAMAKFDMLVTDHKMPRVDGLVLVTRLKETGFTGKMIVHSSRLSEQEVASYRRLGVDLIVMKGPDTEKLVGLTKELFVA